MVQEAPTADGISYPRSFVHQRTHDATVAAGLWDRFSQRGATGRAAVGRSVRSDSAGLRGAGGARTSTTLRPDGTVRRAGHAGAADDAGVCYRAGRHGRCGHPARRHVSHRRTPAESGHYSAALPRGTSHSEGHAGRDQLAAAEEQVVEDAVDAPFSRHTSRLVAARS